EYFKAAIKLDPYYPLPYNNLAVIYKKKKQTDLFVRYLKKSMSLERMRGFDRHKQTDDKTTQYRLLVWLTGIIILLFIFFKQGG
ncbi:MAG: tetratricopeptide repeat protein, partial [Thermoanaerobacterales bacterium]|nr:tetratricopeptide repeat protein [Thermoanaerobacterales bacterium]